MLDNAANREMVADTMVGRELLGISMSTHLQVQCSTTDFPLSEEECDLSATELYRLVEAGNPLLKPVETNGTQVHAHGEEWCGVFFDRFFAAILTELESK